MHNVFCLYSFFLIKAGKCHVLLFHTLREMGRYAVGSRSIYCEEWNDIL